MTNTSSKILCRYCKGEANISASNGRKLPLCDKCLTKGGDVYRRELGFSDRRVDNTEDNDGN